MGIVMGPIIENRLREIAEPRGRQPLVRLQPAGHADDRRARSPRRFAAATERAARGLQEDQGMSRTDVAIIGAGIAGASLAAALAADAEVVLIEAEARCGFHASGRSAAVFVPNYGDAAIRVLTGLSRPTFDTPDPAFWDGPLLKPRGLLRLCAPGGEAEYAAIHRGAVGVEELTLTEACAFFPVLRPKRFTAASFESDVHDIDADLLLGGLLRKARRHGAQIVTGSAVTSLFRRAGLWHLCAGAEEIVAPIVVNAGGAWADEIAALAGVDPLGLAVLRRSVAVLPLPTALAAADRCPFVVPFPLGWYAKEEAGRLLVSPGDADPVAPHDAWADDMVLAEGLDRFSRDTSVELTQLESAWAGLRTYTPDGHPAIGWAPGSDGFFWLAGQGGFGIQTAPGVAAIAAALLGGTAPPVDSTGTRAGALRRLRGSGARHSAAPQSW